MKPARLAVLGIALVAGLGAAYLSLGRRPPAAPALVAAPAAPRTAEVLVARGDVPIGGTLTANELRWQPWPHDLVPARSITREAQPNAIEAFAGAIARQSLVANDPIRDEKIIKANGSGFLAAMLPAGMRALAINIDSRGSNTAGGFILPNDRVDVIRTYRDEDASKAANADVFVTQTLLQGVKVLAIGPQIQEEAGKKVVVGETATLELDPRQIETIALAQRVGQLTLSLRSMRDAAAPTPLAATDDGALTIVRHGTAITSKR